MSLQKTCTDTHVHYWAGGDRDWDPMTIFAYEASQFSFRILAHTESVVDNVQQLVKVSFTLHGKSQVCAPRDRVDFA